MKPETLHLDRVSAFRAETPAAARRLAVSTTSGLTEMEAIRFLVKECGWNVPAPGVLQHGWRVKEVA